jgi:hypothetical protein
MPIQVHGVLVRAMSGTELSRVRTEFRLRLPEPINHHSSSRGRHCDAIKSAERLAFQEENPDTKNCSPAWSLASVETRQWLFGTLTGAAPRELRLG